MFRFGFHRKKKRPLPPQVPVLITAEPAKADSLTPADEGYYTNSGPTYRGDKCAADPDYIELHGDFGD